MAQTQTTKPVNGQKTASHRKATFEPQRGSRTFGHLSKCSANDLAAMQRACIEAMTTLRRIELL